MRLELILRLPVPGKSAFRVDSHDQEKLCVVFIPGISWVSEPKVEKLLLGFVPGSLGCQSREPKYVAWVSSRIS